MLKVFSAGPECLERYEIKQIGQALAAGHDVALCFAVRTAPLFETADILKSRVLSDLHQKMTLAEVPPYVPFYRLIEDLPDDSRQGVWITITPSRKNRRKTRRVNQANVHQEFAGGPEMISNEEMSGLVKALNTGQPIVLGFSISVGGPKLEFPWEFVSRTLDQKLRAAGIKRYSIMFETTDPKPIRGHQGLRVTIQVNPVRSG